ncbi:cytochrome c oxidase assembly protein [Micromonospora sp. NPDC047707]|uniref:cytochrome c oxidase assembly protein n=1 Tax=Micromonospora sp. NPDC047707 TaxID=3154498 RepID=UPI003452FD47
MTLTHAGHPADGFPAAALVPLVLFWGYLAAALGQRDRAGWSHRRTVSFGLGATLLVAGLLWPARDLPGHMVQHLLLGMLAPLALVLGAPGTLALRAVGPRTGRAAVRLLRHPAAGALAHPVTGLLLTAGGLWLLYLTPLYRASLDNAGLHALVQLHFVLSGYLFAWSIAGPDPGPHRPRVPVRLVVLGVGVAAHAALAQVLYAGVLVDVPATAAELQAGATIMYYGGDLAEILLALALLVTWRPERAASRPQPAAVSP